MNSLRSPVHPAVKEEITRRLDSPLPVHDMQMPFKIARIIKVFHNLVPASIVEFPLSDAGVIDLRVVQRGRLLCLQAIDKEQLPVWLECILHSFPETLKSLGRDVG